MIGIRWITGLPLGYGAYKLIMWINYNLLFFLAPNLSFIPEVLWQIEALIINGILSIYIAVGFTYMFLPRDNFALIHNVKIKVIYWSLSIWTILQLIVLGVLLHDAFTNYIDGMIFQILYVPLMIITMWITYKAILMLDYKYNQPARDYYEQMRLQEEQAAVSQ